MSPEVKRHQDRQGASDKTSGGCLITRRRALGACLGHEAGDSKGQQRCPAGSCALALTSGEGPEQRRSPRHVVHGMQEVADIIGLAVAGRPIPGRGEPERRRRPRPDGNARRRSAESVRGGAAQQPGACWACRGRSSPGHGSRLAAASVSVARKRRCADRAGGDLW